MLGPDGIPGGTGPAEGTREMTGLSIVAVRDATPQEWDDAWDGCSYATFFQSREWFEIWARWYRGRLTPIPKVLVFSDGRKALVPLAELVRHHGLVKEHTTSPGDGYGGWLSLNNLGPEHAARIRDHLLGLTNLHWRLNPHDPMVPAAEVPVTDRETLEVFDLRRLDAGMPADLDGSLELATSGDHWRAYHRLRRRAKRIAGGRRDWRLLDHMYGKGSEDVRLWMVRRGTDWVAGAIFLFANAHCHVWDISVAPRLGGRNHLDALVAAAVRDAALRHAIPLAFDGMTFAAIPGSARRDGAAERLEGGRFQSASAATRLVRQLSAIKRAAIGSPRSSPG